MLFNEIIGQQEVRKKLLSLVREDRLPHALMLYGQPGTGKLPLAVALARYLSCSDRQEEDSCGSCPSCMKFSKLIHPDLHFVVPVVRTGSSAKGAETDDYLPDWRTAFLEDPYLSENQWYETLGAENKQGIISVKESESVIRKLGFKPYESEYRMMIIWLPERMNGPAANKLLKLIEEPPPATLITMVSEHTDRILPTILSRTQLLHVSPLSDEDIRAGLEAQGKGEAGLLDDAVRRANGNYSAALRTLDQDKSELQSFEQFTGLMRLCYSRDIIKINDWVEEVAGIGRERQKQLIDYSLRLIRENFVMHLENDSLNYMSGKERAFSERFSAFIHRENVFALAEAFNLAGNHIEANGNPRIVLMDLSIRVIRLLMVKSPAVQ